MNLLEQYGPLGLFFAFAIAHTLADYPLQGDYLAKAKERTGRNANSKPGEWQVALTAHSMIHAGGVWIVSGSAILGVVELVLHWLIDFGKGEGRYGLVTDQCLHLGSKVAYVVVLIAGWL